MTRDDENPIRALATQKLPPDKLEHSMRVAWLASRQGHDYGVVGLAHDMFEDSDVTAAELRVVGVTDEQLEAVRLLTRGTEPYEEYIGTIALSGNRLALSVKLCDLLDHLDPAFNAGLTDEKVGKYLAALPRVIAALRQANNE